MPAKKQIIIFLSLILFFSTLIAVIRHFGMGIRLPALESLFSPAPLKNIRCSACTTVGHKTLRLVFTIPIQDRRQRDQLLRQLPRIKHDLQISASEPQATLWLEIRDFRAIKAHLLKIVNRHSRRPLEALYLESFFYD